MGSFDTKLLRASISTQVEIKMKIEIKWTRAKEREASSLVQKWRFENSDYQNLRPLVHRHLTKSLRFYSWESVLCVYLRVGSKSSSLWFYDAISTYALNSLEPSETVRLDAWAMQARFVQFIGRLASKEYTVESYFKRVKNLNLAWSTLGWQFSYANLSASPSLNAAFEYSHYALLQSHSLDCSFSLINQPSCRLKFLDHAMLNLWLKSTSMPP